jgi:hypothetical protein
LCDGWHDIVSVQRLGKFHLRPFLKMKSKLTIFLLIVPLLAWIAFELFGEPATNFVVSRFGERIIASGEGKFTNPHIFVERLFLEGACLLTAACVLVLLSRQGVRMVRRRLDSPACWVVQGWIAFICLNLFLATCAQTLLFWCVLYTGKENVNNYTQWQIKRALLKQVEAPSQAFLLGASQTRAEIDTKILNETLGKKLWSTELHFPGSSPYDMSLCLKRLPAERVAFVITYLSEADFYGSGDDERLMYFFGIRDLPEYWTLGGGKPSVDQYFVSGILGDIVPLYHLWDSLSTRIHGARSVNQRQQQHDNSLEIDLTARAQRIASSYHLGPKSEFNKQSLVRLAQMCRERHCRLVICCGQLNPLLGQKLDPALRRDMVAFLQKLAQEDSNIILIDEHQMPRQVESDYEDLTHVNPAARARFSQFLAEKLQDLTVH